MKLRELQARSKHGTVLIAVIICLGLIGALLFSAVHISLKQRRQLDRELQMEQTRWLADAGLAHAKKLVGSGEELPKSATVIRPELKGYDVCEVKIEFDTADKATFAKVSAWIGTEDRPELQTRYQLTKEVKKPSGE